LSGSVKRYMVAASQIRPRNVSTTINPKQLVASNYDAIAETHTAWAGRLRTDERAQYAGELLSRLPAGACWSLVVASVSRPQQHWRSASR
jgi:hypothetical protein